MRNLPNNDEEYDKLLERIVKGAEYLENPLIKPEDFEKGMKLYDELCSTAIEYRRHNGANRPKLQPGTEPIHANVHGRDHTRHAKTA